MPRTINIKGFEIENKTYTYVVQLGGLNKLLEYYQSGKSLINIRSIGAKTARELAALCKYLIRKDDAQFSESLNIGEDEFNQMLSAYIAEKSICSVRTKNALSNLELEFGVLNNKENLRRIIEFILEEGYINYLPRGAGAKVMTELHQMRNLLLKIRQLENREVISINQKSSLELVEEIIPLLQNKYRFEKSLTSKRTQNVLDRLEERFNLSASSNGIREFIQYIIHERYLEERLANAGAMVNKELNKVQENLKKLISDSCNLSQEEYNNFNLVSLLNQSFQNQDLSGLKIGENFSLQRVICLFLVNGKYSKGIGGLVEKLFFNPEILSNKDIAKDSTVTIETVRNALHYFVDAAFPKFVDSIKAINGIIVENCNSNKYNSFFQISPIEKFWFGNKDYLPNIRFSEILLQEFYKDEFHFINQIFSNDMEDSRVFSCAGNFYFVRKDLFQKSCFLELLKFLENEIYLFECAEFDYNLRILIVRFYSEHNYEYHNQMIDDIYEVVLKLKRTKIEVNYADVKRLKRRVTKDSLKQVIEEFLREKGEAQKTADIVYELENNDIEVDVSKLLNQLNKWPQTFARLGNGMWGLREWVKGDAPKGSIREIVEGLLETRSKPMHVSEILNYFETFRPITEHSLQSNIRVSENIHFYFFNCGFIGLKSRKYDDSWYKIPRFAASRFRSVYFDESLSYEKKIQKLETFGYPKIHCDFIISKWPK